MTRRFLVLVAAATIALSGMLSGAVSYAVRDEFPGPPGATGAQGPAGAAGATGAVGQEGAEGLQGPAGSGLPQGAECTGTVVVNGNNYCIIVAPLTWQP